MHPFAACDCISLAGSEALCGVRPTRLRPQPTAHCRPVGSQSDGHTRGSCEAPSAVPRPALRRPCTLLSEQPVWIPLVLPRNQGSRNIVLGCRPFSRTRPIAGTSEGLRVSGDGSWSVCRTYRLVFPEPPGSSIHAPPPPGCSSTATSEPEDVPALGHCWALRSLCRCLALLGCQLF